MLEKQTYRKEIGVSHFCSTIVKTSTFQHCILIGVLYSILTSDLLFVTKAQLKVFPVIPVFNSSSKLKTQTLGNCFSGCRTCSEM